MQDRAAASRPASPSRPRRFRRIARPHLTSYPTKDMISGEHVIGCLIVRGSFGFDTAPEGAHNISLLQEQMMIFCLGALSTVVGAIAAVAGTVLDRLAAAPVHRDER